MSLVRKVAVNAVAAATGRVLLVMTGVVSVGIATRYLGLEAYGALTTATAFVTALAPLNDIGVSAIAARELAKHPEEKDRLIGSVLTLALGMSLVTTAVGVGAVHLLYPGADNETVRNAVMIMLLIALPTSALSAPASAYLIATQRAWTAMAAGVGGSLLTLLLLVLTVDAGLGLLRGGGRVRGDGHRLRRRPAGLRGRQDPVSSSVRPGSASKAAGLGRPTRALHDPRDPLPAGARSSCSACSAPRRRWASSALDSRCSKVCCPCPTS